MKLSDDKHIIQVEEPITGLELQNQLQLLCGLLPIDYYLIHDGKIIRRNGSVSNGVVHIIPRVFGGKGGFGSMLRAIGAQIEKTTNREACRDLSGRRLRDINEEQRLKNWIAQQADREKEAKDRKKKKLEKLCEKPNHEFKDEEYDKERSVLPEIIEDAVLQGLQASSSSSKRKTTGETPVTKKKPKLWMDEDLDEEDINSDDDNNSDEASAESIEKDSPNETANHENTMNDSKDPKKETIPTSIEKNREAKQ